MLKKAGIIVAAVATGVLAVSSLAFADESTGNLSNDCAFGNEGGSPVAAAENDTLASALSVVLGLAVDATTQTNTLDCNNINVEDVLDQNSNNETTTKSKSMIEDSFNTED